MLLLMNIKNYNFVINELQVEQKMKKCTEDCHEIMQLVYLPAHVFIYRLHFQNFFCVII